jgi:hypothetical protein
MCFRDTLYSLRILTCVLWRRLIFPDSFLCGALYNHACSSAARRILTRPLSQCLLFRSAFLHDALNSQAHTSVASFIPKCTPARRNYAYFFRSCCLFLSGILCLFYCARCLLMRFLFWRVILNDLFSRVFPSCYISIIVVGAKFLLTYRLTTFRETCNCKLHSQCISN